MTGAQLREIQGFLDEYYEEFEQYLSTDAGPPHNDRAANGADEAEQLMAALHAAIEWTQNHQEEL